MDYEIIIPPTTKQALLDHLLKDRSREQIGVLLCGVARSKNRRRLLGRHLITMPSDAFSHQSSVGLELDQTVQKHVLQLAAREGLSQVDFHTHPGDGPSVGFSGIDDRNEVALAKYLARNIPGTVYSSVVLNGQAAAARVWEVRNGDPVAKPITPPILASDSPTASRKKESAKILATGRYDRQVRAFGFELQRRLSELKVGIVGVGGLGSIIVEELARLGVRDWVLVDHDIVEESNLNRLLGATERDVEGEISKVEVARRNIKNVNPKASVKIFRSSVFVPRTLKALKECDLLIASTDNHASRLVLNSLSCQFLIPLVHVGVNLEPDENGGFEDISGEIVIPSHGEWCLLCGGIIDAQHAAREMAPREEQSLLVERGYIPDTPAPAVYHLNALVASLAVTEIHNLIWPYKPLRRYVAYRELEGEMMSIEIPKSESCLHCSPEGILGRGDLAPIWNPKPIRSLSAFRIPPGFDGIESNQLEARIGHIESCGKSIVDCEECYKASEAICER
jgi:hypothetical protein